MPRLTIQNVILGGIGAIILGFLYAFGSKIFDIVSNTSPTQAESLALDSITIGLVGAGIIVVIVGVWYLRKKPEIPSSSDRIKQVVSQSIPEGKELVQQSGLSVFTRAEIEPYFEKFLQEATHDVVIVGASLHLSVTGKEDIFRRLIEQRRLSVKFLMLNPASNLVKQLDGDLDWILNSQMKTTIDSFNRLKGKLSPNLKEKLQIGFYDRIPIVGLIILDPESPTPTIQVVNYASGPDIGSRFAIQIRGLERSNSIPQKYLEEYRKFVESSEQQFKHAVDDTNTTVRP